MVFTVDASDIRVRLDHFVHGKMPQHSRARIQEWIKAGRVRVHGKIAKASVILRGGETIEVDPAPPPPLKAEPEDLPVEVLYEDDAVVAVNKPAGIVVHAGAGDRAGTLTNRLVARFERLSKLGGELRPGIVHRLDKDTSGVLLVAKTDAAHRALAEQFAGRSVEKTYLALVHGSLKKDKGRIDAPIARDPVRRTRMTTRLAHGRESITEYRTLARYQGFTYLEVRIGTGRTHQIRAHLSSIGHAVAGDRVYGAPRSAAGRFFLHAWRITFSTPSSGERITVEAPLPADLEQWLAGLTII